MALLLFNWIGYRLVSNLLQQRADRQLEARIDINNYDDEQLMEIRVALNMPYQSVNTSFERHYGEIELGGKSYTYVKRKVEDGVLVLECLPNHTKDVIKDKSNTNLPFAKVVKAFNSSDFDNDKPLFQLEQPATTDVVLNSFITPFITSGFLSTTIQPPDAA